MPMKVVLDASVSLAWFLKAKTHNVTVFAPAQPA
jgi:hypothetical protein